MTLSKKIISKVCENYIGAIYETDQDLAATLLDFMYGSADITESVDIESKKSNLEGQTNSINSEIIKS